MEILVKKFSKKNLQLDQKRGLYIWKLMIIILLHT